MIVGGSDEEAISTISEELTIINGTVTLSDTPNNNILIDVQVKWSENGQDFIEDVAYSCLDKVVSVSTYYDGKTLSVTYLKNKSGKLYQIGTGTGSGVSSFNDLSDKPTTISGYGITDAYTKTEVDSKITNIDLSNIDQNILPSVSSTYSIGSVDKRFKSLYVDEAYLSTNTLYIGDTPVLGTNQDTILIKADIDQSITMASYGTGDTTIQSASGVNLTTSGMNADVKVQAVGTNSKVRLAGSGGIELSDNTSIQSNLSVSGSLTVTGDVAINGSTFTVNSTTVTTKDNIIVLNNGEVGSGVTAGRAGIKIDRGDAVDYELVFDETDDKFKVGQVGSTYETLATREYISTYTPSYSSIINKPTTISGYGITDAYTKTEVDTSLDLKVDKIVGKGLSTEDYSTAEKTKLSGIESGAQVNTVSSVAGKTGIVTLDKADVGLSLADNTADASKSVLSATKLTTARTINGVSFNGSTDITINAVDSTARIASSEKGVANGVATLDASGLVPSAQLPSYVDDVLEFATLSVFPATGEAGKIYVDLATNKTYRWSGTTYIYITSGAVDSVAGKTGVVSLVKADVGLGNVDNTSDLNKPISAATKTALNSKADTATTLSGYGITDAYTKTQVDSKIGVSIQAYNANTVIDSNYVHTDNNYTTLEKNKLSTLVNYSLPIASNSILGGIKIGTGLSIDSNGVVTNIGAGQMLGNASTKTINYSSKVISENINITSDINASAVGPISISDGYIVSVADGARFVII